MFLNRIARIRTAVAGVVLALSVTAFAQDVPKWDTFSDTWVATDGLGRSLPTHEQVGGPKKDKTVGLFYFVWIDGRSGKVIDNTKELAKDPDKIFKYAPNVWHWWGEPIFGYYLNVDPYIIRKHAQMLSDAGVDTLIYDCTNVPTNEERVTAIGEVFTDIRQNTGQSTPQMMFMTNNNSGKKVQALYDLYYKNNKFPGIMFEWLGKPLILARVADMSEEMKAYFTVRFCWAWHAAPWFGTGENKWTWTDNWPQKAGWTVNPQTPEEVSVSIAQHATTSKGRSYHKKHNPKPEDQNPHVGWGFDEQWKRALEINPPFVLVTGWNEWIAPMQRVKDGKPAKYLGKPLPADAGFFVDQYDMEYSRDAEPMRGPIADNYYYQMIDGIRRYKGVRPIETVSPKPIAVDGAFADWTGVTPEFRDTIGDPAKRDHAGFEKGSRYVNTTGRNDIVAAKLSFDPTDVYFYVRSRDALTPPTDKDWMRLYVDTDRNPRNGWMGYDVLIERDPADPARYHVRRHTGKGFEWAAGEGRIGARAAGNEMELAVPRALLGLPADAASIDFKWADNCHQLGDWSDFTLNGDTAPNDRFNYRAKRK